MARERMGCQRETPGGRSDLWISKPFEVPPRAKEAGKLAAMLLLVLERGRCWLLGHDIGAEGFDNADAGLEICSARYETKRITRSVKDMLM